MILRRFPTSQGCECKSSPPLVMQWDEILVPLCRRHGEAVVWEEGLKALEYPPTWATTGRELDVVIGCFSNSKKG